MVAVLFLFSYVPLYAIAYCHCIDSVEQKVTDETEVFRKGELGKAPEGYVLSLDNITSLFNSIFHVSLS